MGVELLHEKDFYVSLMEKKVSDLEKIITSGASSSFLCKSTREYLTSLLNFEIPEDFDPQAFYNDAYHNNLNLSNYLHKYSRGKYLVSVRDLYIYLGGYSVITKKWLNTAGRVLRRSTKMELRYGTGELSKVLRGSTVLEVMCGSGMLSKGLRDLGINVIATDYDNKDDSYSIYTNRKWIDDIETIDAVAAVKKYANDIDFIVMSWPPLGNTIDYEVLRAMNKYCKKDCFILYLGELGDCCGSKMFSYNCENLTYISKLLNKNFRSHRYIHDRVYLLH